MANNQSSYRERRSKARRKSAALKIPNSRDDQNLDRNGWLERVSREFIGDPTNKLYYRVILETAWPLGHGIPGPHVTQEDFRNALNEFRKKNRVGRDPDRDYLDVFRRVRELQGEEGLVGLIKSGHTYQLVDLELAPKRIRRVALDQENWESVLQKYDGRCANCKRSPPEVRLQQDHKVPRVRPDKATQLVGGINDLENWQPLCDECNNFKSTSCRGCKLDCFECPWAYPEKFKALRVAPATTARLLSRAKQLNVDPDELLNLIVEDFLE